jgi:glycosyltransferase involved in cell wall biosynthesis
MHIGLVLISPGIGGTEKRFANLFNYLSEQSNNRYSLLISAELLLMLQRAGLLPEAHPEIVPLFARGAAALAGKLPTQIGGVKIPGVIRFQNLCRGRELASRAGQSRFGSLDLIHYAFPYAYFLGCLPLDRAMVVEAQDTTLLMKNQGGWRQSSSYLTFTRAALENRALVNCASARVRQAYRELMPEERFAGQFQVSPCSFIDYRRMAPAPKEKLITFCGRLEPVKNPQLFVRAIGRLARTRSDFRACLLGGGEEEPIVRRLIAEMGLGGILECRFESQPQTILARSLIYASLQSGDNYHSQALMEAMACGCAVVASEVGETWRLVSEQVGFRARLEAEAVAARFDFLLDHFDLAVEMGRAGRAKVMSEQSVEIYSGYLEDLYGRAHRFFREA